jgi:hypothetical protein
MFKQQLPPIKGLDSLSNDSVASANPVLPGLQMESHTLSQQTTASEKFYREPDLADHFLTCSKLGRYLTVEDGSRFVITDDFRTSPVISSASAIAAIFSKDFLVAQTALLPLSDAVETMTARERDKFERLFVLIEEQALADPVKNSARAIRQANFRRVEIRALEVELGDKLNPARFRYREFLDIIKKLMNKKLTAGPFLDEFRSFTSDVAGRLDFGIYSFCLDRLMGSLRVPKKVKKLLVLEILKYPAVIRRELLSNILTFPGQAQELLDFVKFMIQSDLDKAAGLEIELLEAFKLHRLTVSEIEGSLVA